MRSYNTNPDASGNGPFSDFINRALKRLTELQFYSSDTVTVEQTTRGTRFHTKLPAQSQGGSGWIPRNGKYEVDNTNPYAANNVIHIQPTHDLVITGIRDAANPTGPLVMSKRGYYVSTRPVSAKTTVGGNDVWNLPQFPLPNPDNIDDPLNFWIYLGETYC